MEHLGANVLQCEFHVTGLVHPDVGSVELDVFEGEVVLVTHRCGGHQPLGMIKVYFYIVVFAVFILLPLAFVLQLAGEVHLVVAVGQFRISYRIQVEAI